MVQAGSTALANVVIERDMPRGYTWAKFRNCWTGDLAEGRFMPPERNARTGDIMPAAFFCTIVVHDPERGFHERDVKFQGADAEAMVMHQSDHNIVRLNADGHVSTRAIITPEGTVARSIVFIKEGTVQVLEVCKQTPRPAEALTLEEYANRRMRELEPADSAETRAMTEAFIREARQDESIWPSAPEPENLDEAPF